MRRALSRLAAVAGLVLSTSALAAPALAAPPQKAELLAKASEGGAICAAKMPGTSATAEALRAAGFTPQGGEGTFRVYSAHGNRVVVVVTAGGARGDGCMVPVSRMTPAEAERLAAPYIAQSGARPAAPPRGFDVDRFWLGHFKGAPLLIGIKNNLDLGIVRGAAVIARNDHKR